MEKKISPQSPLLAPILISPENNTVNIPTDPTFTWSAVESATTYQLQVSTNSNFNSTIFDQSGITATSQQVTGLANNTTYYWRLNARNAGGTSDWSTAWSFTTVTSEHYSLRFDGVDDYVQVDNFPNELITNNLTMECWLYLINGGNGHVFSKRVYNSINFSLEVAPQNQKLYVHFGSLGNFFATTVLSNNTWYHVAVTYDNQNIRIYVNGILDGKLQTTGDLGKNSATFVIGRYTEAYPANYFSGVIDEVRFSNNVRYSNTFTPPTSEFVSDSNTVALYHFNEGTGNFVTDASGNGNHGTIHGATWSTDVPNPPTQGETPQYVFLANEQIIVRGLTVSEGDIYSNDIIKFNKGKSGTHTGAITAVGNIKIQQKNRIEGDVTAGGSVDNSGTVTGTIAEHASVSVVPLPTLSFSAGGSNETVPKNGSLTLASGSYRNVKVKRGGRLELSSGDYFMKSLNLDRSSVLSVDVSAGAVTINVVGLISFDKNVEVEIVPFGESGTDQVTFNSLNDGSLKIRTGAKVLGSIVATHAKVSIDKNVRFKGLICAQVISVNKGATFLNHNSTTSLPKIAPIEESEISEDLEQETIPTEYELGHNYPNPFNPTTNISYQLPNSGMIELSIYNILGELVEVLVNEYQEAGFYRIVWDASKVSSGVYLYRITTGDFSSVKKALIMK